MATGSKSSLKRPWPRGTPSFTSAMTPMPGPQGAVRRRNRGPAGPRRDARTTLPPAPVCARLRPRSASERRSDRGWFPCVRFRRAEDPWGGYRGGFYDIDRREADDVNWWGRRRQSDPDRLRRHRGSGSRLVRRSSVVAPPGDAAAPVRIVDRFVRPVSLRPLWLTAGFSAQILFERLGIYDRLLPQVEGDVGDLGPDVAKAARYLKAIRLNNLSQPLGALLFLAMSFSLLPIFQRAAVSQVGMTLARWRPNVVLGLGVFVVADAVDVRDQSCMQSTCLRWSSIRSRCSASWRGSGLLEWASLFVNVVVLGPICEEWLFRGLLQGWLTSNVSRTRPVGLLRAAAAVGFLIAMRKVGGVEVPIGLVAWTAAMLAAVDLAGVYALFRPLHDLGLAFFRRGDLPPLPDEERIVDAWTVNLFAAEGTRAS